MSKTMSNYNVGLNDVQYLYLQNAFALDEHTIPRSQGIYKYLFNELEEFKPVNRMTDNAMAKKKTTK